MNFGKFISKIMILGTFSMITSSVVVSANTSGTISGDNVNIRAAGSPEAEVLSTINYGQVVSVLERQGDYYQVSIDGAENRFISSQFVNIKEFDGVIDANSVNIRKSPASDAEILSKASLGQHMQILEIQGEWCAVQYNGTKAFVHKDYISSPLMNEIPVKELQQKPLESQPQEQEPQIQEQEPQIQEREPQIQEREPQIQEREPQAQEPQQQELEPPQEPQTESRQVQQADQISAIVNVSDLSLYEIPSTGSPIITSFNLGDTLDVISFYNDEWVQVLVDGHHGFVNSGLISLQIEETLPSESETKANEIVAFAKQYLGIPYRSGGTSLRTGVDCSGFTYAVMKNFGISLGRSSRDQVHNGRSVNRDELKPADLLFFNTGGNSSISHVGMYIGDGQYIHSSTTSVIISSLSNAYNSRTYVTARRIIE